MGKVVDFLAHAWNSFTNRSPTNYYSEYGSYSSSIRPDRVRLTGGNEKTIATSVFNRIALDVSAVDIRHVKEDENGRFLKFVNDGLDNCLNVEANIDQTGKAFIHDIVMSLLDEGCVAVVPIDTDINPMHTSGFDILSMRVGKIVTWYPDKVKIEVYNDAIGRKDTITMPKSKVAIIENPLYAVINEPNGTYKRLVKKLSLLDELDYKTASGKLDLIFQLPYVVKTEARKKEADRRRKDIEDQLTGSKYGVAYIDATEKVTQLNRPIENNLLGQIEYLTKQFQGELGITPEIMNGTANEEAMINYFYRTTQPMVKAIADEFKRKFLSKTARSQGHNLSFNRNPFNLMPITCLAEIADKFTRNEILTSNEIRGILGFKPADDPKADQLINSNIAQDQELSPYDQQALVEQQMGMDQELSLYDQQALPEQQVGMDQELSDLFDEFINQISGDIEQVTELIKGGDEE